MMPTPTSIKMPKNSILAQCLIAAVFLMGCNSMDGKQLNVPSLNYTFGDGLSSVFSMSPNYDHQRLASQSPDTPGTWLLTKTNYTIVEKQSDGSYVEHPVSGAAQWLNVGSPETIASLANQGNPLDASTSLTFPEGMVVRGIVITAVKIQDFTNDHVCENAIAETEVSISNARVYSNGTLQPRAISPKIICSN